MSGKRDVNIKASVMGGGRISALQKLFLFLVAFLVYANSIPNDFNLDDELYHPRAVKIATSEEWGLNEIFTTRTFIEGDNRYEYRPVALLSFVAQYKMLGDSAKLSHFVNVFLYALTCLLLFTLLTNWLGRDRGWLAFFIALLFALHPLHTEIVDSIKNRDELLAFILALLGLLAAWKAYTSSWWHLFTAAALFLMALMCKVSIALALIVIPLAYYFFSSLSFKKVLSYTVVVLLSFVVYRMLLFSLPANIRQFQEHENPLYGGSVGFLSRVATAVYIIGRYLWLHILPYRLAYYYGSNYVPVVGWDNIIVWISLAFYIALAVYMVMNFRKKTLLVFGITIYLLGILGYSNLLKGVPGLMAERFAYLSSLGFCIAICVLLYQLLKVPFENFSWTKGRSMQLLACIGIITILYSSRIIARNTDWQNKYTLYTHDMPYLENSAKANMLHGDLFATMSSKYKTTAQQLQQQNATLAAVYYDSAAYFNAVAIDNFKQALRIIPQHAAAMINLGLAYFAADSQLQARKYLLKALTLVPQNAKVNCNLGILYFRAGMYDSAVYMVKRAIAADSGFAIAYQTLTDIQFSGHDTTGAANTLRAAARNMQNPIAAYVDLGNIALQRRDTALAVTYFEKAASLKPGSIFALSFLVKYYQDKKDMQQANYYYNILAEVQAQRGGN